MKGTRLRVLAIAAAAVVAGCGGTAPTPAPQDVPDAPPPKYTFAAKSPIPVRLTLRASADGGRVAPLYGGYRPTVVFDADPALLTCSISGIAVGGFGPGDTRDVALRCGKRVSLRPDATGFTMREGEQVVGSGVVLP
jgi:hypothetical protein